MEAVSKLAGEHKILAEPLGKSWNPLYSPEISLSTLLQGFEKASLYLPEMLLRKTVPPSEGILSQFLSSKTCQWNGLITVYFNRDEIKEDISQIKSLKNGIVKKNNC